MAMTAVSLADSASSWLTSRVASLLPATTATAAYLSFHSCQSGSCKINGGQGGSCTMTLYSCVDYSGGGGGEECHKINCCGTCYG